MDPLISIIVPNYNHAEFLKQRLDSVFDQTYQNFEVIILDDCSTDASSTIIEHYRSHPKVAHIIYNSKNSGSAFRQWKKGTELAKGEWIWIAESDDYADPRFLELMRLPIAERSSVGLVYCDSAIVEKNVVRSETFATLKNNALNTGRWRFDHFNGGRDEIANYLLPFGSINNTSAVLFRKAIFQLADPFDIPLTYIGDKYAFVKVLAISDIFYVAKTLNYFRNPFNSKHADRHFIYAFEQFVIFNWVVRNLDLPLKKVMDAFYSNTQQSLVRGWAVHRFRKFRLNITMMRLNPLLFCKNIIYNVLRPLRVTNRKQINQN